MGFCCGPWAGWRLLAMRGHLRETCTLRSVGHSPTSPRCAWVPWSSLYHRTLLGAVRRVAPARLGVVCASASFMVP